MEFLHALLAHTDKIFLGIGALVTAASTIVGLTPSTKDDEILGKVLKVLELFSIFNKKTHV